MVRNKIPSAKNIEKYKNIAFFFGLKRNRLSFPLFLHFWLKFFFFNIFISTFHKKNKLSQKIRIAIRLFHFVCSWLISSILLFIQITSSSNPFSLYHSRSFLYLKITSNSITLLSLLRQTGQRRIGWSLNIYQKKRGL